MIIELFISYSNLACSCNVCNGGAVHNGCVYRELLRLKTEYRLFDKRNLCFCSTCIPFKYRKVCLRQELRNLRRQGIDLYYRSVFLFNSTFFVGSII